MRNRTDTSRLVQNQTWLISNAQSFVLVVTGLMIMTIIIIIITMMTVVMMTVMMMRMQYDLCFVSKVTVIDVLFLTYIKNNNKNVTGLSKTQRMTYKHAHTNKNIDLLLAIAVCILLMNQIGSSIFVSSHSMSCSYIHLDSFATRFYQ